MRAAHLQGSLMIGSAHEVVRGRVWAVVMVRVSRTDRLTSFGQVVLALLVWHPGGLDLLV